MSQATLQYCLWNNILRSGGVRSPPTDIHIRGSWLPPPTVSHLVSPQWQPRLPSCANSFLTCIWIVLMRLIWFIWFPASYLGHFIKGSWTNQQQYWWKPTAPHNFVPFSFPSKEQNLKGMQVSPSPHSSSFLGGRLSPSTNSAPGMLVLGFFVWFSISTSVISRDGKMDSLGWFSEESVFISEGQQYLRKPAGPQNLSRFSFSSPPPPPPSSLSAEQNLSGTHSSDSPQLPSTMLRMAKRITGWLF